jgi:acyl-CoA reductase-like NAD-dependent aldehyde dehydrogenase
MALNVVNPATAEVVAAAPRADRAQLDQAIAAAKAAFPRWSETPVRDLGALLARLADAVEVRQAEFAEILTAENGKPIAQAMFENGGRRSHDALLCGSRPGASDPEGGYVPKDHRTTHAARRGRSDIGVERADDPSSREDRAGAACRQHRYRQAGGDDPAGGA